MDHYCATIGPQDKNVFLYWLHKDTQIQRVNTLTCLTGYYDSSLQLLKKLS